MAVKIEGQVLGWLGVALKKIPVEVPLSRRMKLGELNQLTAVGSINCGWNGQREVRATPVPALRAPGMRAARMGRAAPRVNV
jgi:hypothetical protein